MQNSICLMIGIFVSNYAGINIENLQNVELLRHLIIADMISDAMRKIGYMLIKMLGTFIDYVWECTQEIAMIDFTTIINVGEFQVTIEKLTWGILIISIMLAVLFSYFKKNNDFEYIKITLIAIMAIYCFGEFNTWINNYKNDGITIVDESFNKEDLKLSDRLFYENSYDLLASIKTDDIVTINKKIPVDRLDVNETMSKNDLQGVIQYDENGVMSVRDLSDGFLNSGLFEERYYRYHIGFFGIIGMYLVVGFMLIIGMCKMAYVGYDWFHVKLYGGLGMATSVTTFNKIKTAYTETVKSMMGILFAYVGIYLFQLLVPSVVAGKYNILTQIVLILMGGLVFILGTGFITKMFGIDDGTSFVLKSMMLTSRLGRSISGLNRGISRRFSSKNKKKPNKKDDENGNTNRFTPYEPYGGGDAGALEDGLDAHYTAPSATMYGGDGMSPQNRFAGTLSNKDLSDMPIIGGDGMELAYHQADVNDRWNQERDKKVQERLREYKDAMDAQNNMTKQHIKRMDNEQKEDEKPKVNLMTSADLPTNANVPFKKLVMGKYKPYAQYKKDYKNGDDSVMNPNYKERVDRNDMLNEIYQKSGDVSHERFENMSDDELKDEYRKYQNLSDNEFLDSSKYVESNYVNGNNSSSYKGFGTTTSVEDESSMNDDWSLNNDSIYEKPSDEMIEYGEQEIYTESANEEYHPQEVHEYASTSYGDDNDKYMHQEQKKTEMKQTQAKQNVSYDNHSDGDIGYDVRGIDKEKGYQSSQEVHEHTNVSYGDDNDKYKHQEQKKTEMKQTQAKQNISYDNHSNGDIGYDVRGLDKEKGYQSSQEVHERTNVSYNDDNDKYKHQEHKKVEEKQKQTKKQEKYRNSSAEKIDYGNHKTDEKSIKENEYRQENHEKVDTDYGNKKERFTEQKASTEQKQDNRRYKEKQSKSTTQVKPPKIEKVIKQNVKKQDNVGEHDFDDEISLSMEFGDAVDERNEKNKKKDRFTGEFE